MHLVDMDRISQGCHKEEPFMFYHYQFLTTCPISTFVLRVVRSVELDFMFNIRFLFVEPMRTLKKWKTGKKDGDLQYEILVVFFCVCSCTNVIVICEDMELRHTSNAWKNRPLYAFNATGRQIPYLIQLYPLDKNVLAR